MENPWGLGQVRDENMFSQATLDKMLKTNPRSYVTVFSMECFTTDFLQICRTTVKNMTLDDWMSTSNLANHHLK